LARPRRVICRPTCVLLLQIAHTRDILSSLTWTSDRRTPERHYSDFVGHFNDFPLVLSLAYCGLPIYHSIEIAHAACPVTGPSEICRLHRHGC
jgi:hypothetical protein